MKTTRKILVCGNGFLGKSLLKNSMFFSLGNRLDYSLRHILETDSQMYKTLLAVVRDLHPLAIVNASGPSNIQESFQNQSLYFNFPAMQSSEHLKLISRTNLNIPYVLVSSGAVYGEPSIIPTPETFIGEPISPYAAGKLAAENALALALGNRQNEGKVVILRVFSAYSNSLRKQLLGAIVSKLLSDSHLELSGTGNEIRDFIHVSDVARAIIHILNLDSTKLVDIYNIGNGKGTRIVEVCNLASGIFSNVTGREPPRISFNGLSRKGDPFSMIADVQKIGSTGFRSNISTEFGLSSYFRTRLSGIN